MAPCLIAVWEFGVNDPTLFAWIIVVLYVAATWYCWRAARLSNFEPSSASIRGRLLWWLMALSMMFFGLNKQLDLHSLLFAKTREFLGSDNWYLKATVILILAVFLIAATFAMFRALHGQSIRVKLSYYVLASLLLMQAVRFSKLGISKILAYHILDQNDTWLHLHTIEVFEIGCLCAIIWSARSSVDDNPALPKIAD